jgi:SAM-dependent methyltransferase
MAARLHCFSLLTCADVTRVQKNEQELILVGGFCLMLLLRFLGAVGSLHIAFGRVLAWIYRKVWGPCGLHWFDHRFDLLRGPEFWIWQERGVLGMQVISPGAKILDLCCGEGFYDRMYFAERARQIDALDMDGNAIALARALNRQTNLRFFTADVVEESFPDNDYDVILCFSALQQLSRTQLDRLLPRIRTALKAGGIFFGSVSLTPENDLLRTEDQVRPEFAAYFHSVELNCSGWPNGRVECYFRCREMSVDRN